MSDSELFLAARAGDEDEVRALIEAGADAENSFGIETIGDEEVEFTALTIAARQRHWFTVTALLTATDAIDVDEASFNGQTALWMAAHAGQADVVELLIDAGADVDLAGFPCSAMPLFANRLYSPIAVASERRHWPVVMKLIAAGAKIDCKDGDGLTVLQRAASVGQGDVVEALLAADADPNAGDDRAPLSFATSAAIVRALIAAGAGVDAADANGNTALIIAVNRKLVVEEVVDALAAAGADLNRANNKQLTPLGAAITHSNVVIARKLLDLGAAFDWQGAKRDTALWLAVAAGRDDKLAELVNSGAELNAICNKHDTPLALAVRADAESTLTTLLDLGADIDHVGVFATALCVAVNNDRHRMVDVLLKRGANPNSTGPLGVAVARGNAAIARLLLEHGADTNTPNMLGQLPLLAAVETANEALVGLLLAHGAHIDESSPFRSPTSIATSKRMWPVMLLLVRAGADAAGPIAAAFGEGASKHDFAFNAICEATDLQRVLANFASVGNAKGVATMLAAGADAASVTRTHHHVAWLLAAASPAAKKAIELAGFAMMRPRMLEICVALQELDLPAPLLIEIATASCEPFASRLPFHYLWDLAVKVKHFHR